MITDLIDKFSKGTIEIKFQIVTPLTENKRRNIISVFVFIIYMICAWFIIYLISTKFKLTFVTLFVGIISLFLLFDFLTKKWLLQIKALGTIKFLSDSIEIKLTDNSFVDTFKYSEIKGIRYQHNVPLTLFSRRSTSKTYIIEFVRYKNTPIVIEVEGKLLLTTDDLRQKRTIEPDIKTVFTYLTPKYGIECVRRITTPNSGLL